MGQEPPRREHQTPTSRPAAAPPLCVLDCAPEESQDLLNVIKARLRLIAGAGSTTRSQAATVQLHTESLSGAAVLECASALDHVQTTLARDFARRKKLEQELFHTQAALMQARAELVGIQHLALHDGLTSLPNRRFFLERLNHAIAHTEPQHSTFALIYIDLDRFKPVNDLHGHATGDQVLTIVATRLVRAVRAEDTMSRMGGDEFACLTPGKFTQESLSILASKLLDVVSAPLQIGALTLSVRPSIGIAMYPADGVTADALITSADAAMYRAKRYHSGYAFHDRRTDGLRVGSLRNRPATGAYQPIAPERAVTLSPSN